MAWLVPALVQALSVMHLERVAPAAALSSHEFMIAVGGIRHVTTE